MLSIVFFFFLFFFFFFNDTATTEIYTLSLHDALPISHVASLGMAVAPEWRGRGVGSALMAEAIAWARAHGVEKLALSVYPDNQRALALYAKFGFVEEGRLTGHSRKSIGYRDEI